MVGSSRAIKPLFRAIILGAILLLIVSGCGGDDGDGESADSQRIDPSEIGPGRLTIADGDLYLDEERFILRAVDLTFVWPEDIQVRRRILENIRNLGANTVRYGFYITHENLDLLDEAGLLVLLMPLNSWNTHMTADQMRQFIMEYAAHPHVIGWDLGNELWSDDFTIPTDLILEQMDAIAGSDPLGRPVFYGNHMMINAPDIGEIPFLRERGFGPVDCTDVIGWNPYPLFLALSLDEMIGYFWYSIMPYIEQVSPLLAHLLDEAFSVYEVWADNIPQWLLDDPIGFDYLVYTYWMNSCKQNWDPDRGCHSPKPWILTEWGFTSSPDGIRNVCAIIRDFVEFGSLDGHDFHSYPFLDENVDGVIDHPEAYLALQECFAMTAGFPD